MLIRLGRRPDPGDAFMFRALSDGRVDTRGFEFEHVLRDVRTLDAWALESRLEATAISLHGYPLVQDRYVLLRHGATMGPVVGPAVVARRPLSREELAQVEIAVPTTWTTAFLVLRMFLGEFRYREVPAARILDEVLAGRVDAGVLVREGRYTYADAGLEKCVDLGEWWLLETGLPLPVGVTVARRDLGQERLRDLSAVLRESIAAGLAERRDANVHPCDYGDEGRLAVNELLSRAGRLGVYDRPVAVEFVQER